MQLASPQQYQALDRYLESVAHYALHMHILDQYKRTPLADFSGWQQTTVSAAQSQMASEEAKLNAACAGNFRELFPEALISSLLTRKMSRHGL
jgi:hypothetical protein